MGNLSLTKEARIYNEEKTVTSKNSAGKTGQLHLKSEIRTFSNTIHRNEDTFSAHLNIRMDTIKLLEENRQNTDINHRNIFLDSLPNENKNKIKQWDLIKLKSFCTTKETINRTKRQPSE